MVYFNPRGHNWGPTNLDGYGITYVVFTMLYSIIFYAACTYLWVQRNHPVVKMRKMNLALLSLLVLHVYVVLVLLAYTINGAYPCDVEFWIMSIYLPIGIGLFQAQNQQLLIVSREQNQLVRSDELYKPLFPNQGRGIGGPNYWAWRFKLWWRSVSAQNKYEGFVFVGIVIQFVVSLLLYCISRKFKDYGIVSHHTTPAGCRRGWEWAPSIVWQFLWNYLFGPYLLWKLRKINDIYHWRLQTTLAVIAGIPGTPLWLAATYTNAFTSVNKYWVPPMWIVVGILTIEMVTLAFPILQIFKHKWFTRSTRQVLAAFDAKQLTSTSTENGSMATRSTGSKGGRMYSMESLEECLNTDHDGLQLYASCMELNGENIIFLVKVANFRQNWATTFSKIHNYGRARMSMFRAGLSIYVSLVHSSTASYPINIESPIYARLHSIFGAATELVASRKSIESPTTPISAVTPWDEPPNLDDVPPVGNVLDANEMYAMRSMTLSIPPTRRSLRNESSEHIIPLDDLGDAHDALASFQIPREFDERVFDAAYKSIKYMVWTETWQRYMTMKRGSGSTV